MYDMLWMRDQARWMRGQDRCARRAERHARRLERHARRAERRLAWLARHGERPGGEPPVGAGGAFKTTGWHETTQRPAHWAAERELRRLWVLFAIVEMLARVLDVRWWDAPGASSERHAEEPPEGRRRAPSAGPFLPRPADAIVPASRVG